MPMIGTPLVDEHGKVIGIACSRSRRRNCYSCGHPGSLTCDGCNHVLCTACAVSPRQNLDWCPACFAPAFEHWKSLGPFPSSRPERRNAFRLWARANTTKFLELAMQRTPASIREAGP